ncbi:MAG: Imm27 family immunity protein [Pirellulaceae bacterium]
MIPLQPNEQVLIGRWTTVGGKVVADETARRIDEIVSSSLSKVAVSEDGWDILYVDERDGRKWELTYTHSEWHGGGPPTLTLVSEDNAHRKYKY